jgi:hypothetical protein
MSDAGGPTAAAAPEPDHDFAYLPDNCAMLAKLRLEPLLASAVWKDVESEFANLLPAADVQNLKECESVVVGTLPATTPGQPDDTMIVMRAAPGKTVPFNPGQLPNKTGEETINGKQVHLHRSGPQPQATCLVNPRTLLSGPAGMIRAALQRGASPNAPSRMQAVLEELDFTQPIALGSMPAAWPSAPAPPGAMGPPVQPQQFERVILHGKAEAELALTGKITCRDANTANGLKGWADLMKGFLAAGGNKVPPQAASTVKLFQSLQLEVAGNVVNGKLTVPSSVLIDLIRQSQQQPPPVPKGGVSPKGGF